MTQRCLMCEDPQTIYHWHAGTVRLDVIPGSEGDAVILLEDIAVTATEAMEISDKLLAAVAACDRANGVTW